LGGQVTNPDHLVHSLARIPTKSPAPRMLLSAFLPQLAPKLSIPSPRILGATFILPGPFDFLGPEHFLPASYLAHFYLDCNCFSTVIGSISYHDHVKFVFSPSLFSSEHLVSFYTIFSFSPKRHLLLDCNHAVLNLHTPRSFAPSPCNMASACFFRKG